MWQSRKKLMLYCSIVHEGEAKIEFGVNIEVKNGKADTIAEAILQFLRDKGIIIERVVGLGTDGANVMMGRHNGVCVRLQRVTPRIVATWCVAHRLALVALWAAKPIPYLQTIQTCLVSIYKFFRYSPARYNRIKEMKDVMQMKVRRFKKPTQVRWLSLQESILALISAWGCLVLALGQKAAQNNSDGAAKARGILRTIHNFKFIATVCILADVLECICISSKEFQKDVIDIEEVSNMLASTVQSVVDLESQPGYHYQDFMQMVNTGGQYQGIDLQVTQEKEEEVMRTYISFSSKIQLEMQKRFPDTDMQTQKDLAAVLDPEKLPVGVHGLHRYGEELERLLQKYDGLAAGNVRLDADRARRQYGQFKNYLSRHRGKGNLKMMSKLLINNHKDTYPDFYVLANISVTIPVSSVSCECGFSGQNRIHTQGRSSLCTKSVNAKLIIAHEAREEDFKEEDVLQRACQVFQKAKKRKVRKQDCAQTKRKKTS